MQRPRLPKRRRRELIVAPPRGDDAAANGPPVTPRRGVGRFPKETASKRSINSPHPQRPTSLTFASPHILDCHYATANHAAIHKSPLIARKISRPRVASWRCPVPGGDAVHLGRKKRLVAPCEATRRVGVGDGRLCLDGTRDVAETVGLGLAGTCCPNDKDDKPYEGNQVDEPPTTGLAYVVHTTP